LVFHCDRVVLPRREEMMFQFALLCLSLLPSFALQLRDTDDLLP
jgi:hypothetical protein